jgi:glycine/D-amino acid oxidase-like deaminating enzyme
VPVAVGPNVLIVGAGIIGAAIGYHLVRGGARVTILDGGEPGGLATRNSWAWINASWGNPRAYVRLRMRSMEEWRRLERAVPALRVRWTGGLLWDLPPTELETFAEEHASWGYPIRLVDGAEAQRIEPALANPPDFALHVASEGAVEPLAAALALLDAAKRHGATVTTNTPVSGIDVRAGRAVGVETVRGPISADEIVIAAGAQTPSLAATAGVSVPLSAPPGLLVVTKPQPKLLNGLVMAPELHMRQRADGCLLAGADFGGTDPGVDPDGAAAALFAATQRMLRSGGSLAFDRYTLGYRPLPADGLPIIGHAEQVAGLYIAAMHSGITLAPAGGRFAAAEIIGGERDPLLAAYAPGRFSA